MTSNALCDAAEEMKSNVLNTWKWSVMGVMGYSRLLSGSALRILKDEAGAAPAPVRRSRLASWEGRGV